LVSPASSPKNGLAVASVVSSTPTPLMADAIRSRDPTHTKRVRAAFRKAAQQRLWRLRAQLRIATVDHDILGLSGQSAVAYQPQALRLQAFHEWFASAASNALAGPWPQWFIEQAWNQGSDEALKEGISRGWHQTPPGGAATVSQLAQQEIKGITAAMVQNVGREAEASLLLNKRRAYQKLARAIDKYGELRLSLMADTLIVKAFNQAKLVTYKHNGVTHVGIEPELKPPKRLHTDAKYAPRKRFGPVEFLIGKELKALGLEFVPEPWTEELVNVVTAGDDLVCEECQDIADDSPYELDEAMALLPAHPQCRCKVMLWTGGKESRDSISDVGWTEEAREAARRKKQRREGPRLPSSREFKYTKERWLSEVNRHLREQHGGSLEMVPQFGHQASYEKKTSPYVAAGEAHREWMKGQPAGQESMKWKAQTPAQVAANFEASLKGQPVPYPRELLKKDEHTGSKGAEDRTSDVTGSETNSDHGGDV